MAAPDSRGGGSWHYLGHGWNDARPVAAFVQHIAYGYSLHAIVSSESFFEGASASSPLRRLLVLCVCGVVAGIGWWALYRFGSPLVSIAKAIKNDGARMPFLSTVAHDVLQIVTVAMGSPLGREVAPREVGAVFATWISSRAGLSAENQRIMIACGAGAGLSAVYNVPLGGAFFTLEALLGTLALYGLAIHPTNPEDIRIAASQGPQRAHARGGSSIFRREADLWVEDAEGFPCDLSLIPVLATHAEQSGSWFALSNLGLFSKEPTAKAWIRLTGLEDWHDMHPTALAVLNS